MFDLHFEIIREYAPYFLSGTVYTVEISAAAIVFGTLLGLFLALARLYGKKWCALPASCFVEMIRGTPLLLQLFIVYFGVIPLFVNKPDGLLAAAAALSINAGAYISETFRAGIQAVPREQSEAARSLGLSWKQSMRYVILPQAVRNVLPPLGNSFVSLIKDSSLASVIAAPELMYWANAANAQYYRVWETFITTGCIYFALTFVTNRLLGRLERKFSYD